MKIKYYSQLSQIKHEFYTDFSFKMRDSEPFLVCSTQIGVSLNVYHYVRAPLQIHPYNLLFF